MYAIKNEHDTCMILFHLKHRFADAGDVRIVDTACPETKVVAWLCRI
jgi:hypothetical protein